MVGGIGCRRGRGCDGLPASATGQQSAWTLLSIVAGALWGGLSATGCHATARPAANVKVGADDTTRLGELRQAVASRVGTTRCVDRSQCRAMPLGSKPCGGPWSYVVYSTATTDSGALALAVQRYNVADAELNRKLGRVSDCSFVSPPKLDCVLGFCAPDSRPRN